MAGTTGYAWRNPRWSSLVGPDADTLAAIFEDLSAWLANPTFNNGITIGNGGNPSVSNGRKAPPSQVVWTAANIGGAPTLDTTAPTAVSGLALTPGVQTILARWTANSDDDVKDGHGTYVVEISSESDFSSILDTHEVGGTVTVFDGLSTGTTYYVRVKAKDYSGNVSEDWSSVVSATPIAVDTVDIAAGSITTTEIADDSITTPKLVAEAVTAAKIAANTITASQIAANTITAAEIQAGTITATELAADSVTAAKLAAVAIEAGKYIRSTTYTAGTAGWTIEADGTAEFNNVVVRGNLAASNIVGDLTMGTGGKIRTATAGNPRIELSTALGNKIEFYSDHAEETQAASITSDFNAFGQSIQNELILDSGATGNGTSQIILRSEFHDVTSDSEVLINADSILLTSNGRQLGITDNFCGTFGVGFTVGGVVEASEYRGTSNGGGKIKVRNAANTVSWSWDGTYRMFVDNTQVKTFVIEHPMDPERHLIHATLEGPENGVYYRGEGRLADGWAQIDLPEYFEALCAEEGRSVQLTCIADNAEDEWCPVLHATYPKDGKFHVGLGSGVVVPDQRFWWEVKAVRKDVAPLLVEPRRDEVDVFGEGPYKYYSVKGAA